MVVPLPFNSCWLFVFLQHGYLLASFIVCFVILFTPPYCCLLLILIIQMAVNSRLKFSSLSSSALLWLIEIFIFVFSSIFDMFDLLKALANNLIISHFSTTIFEIFSIIWIFLTLSWLFRCRIYWLEAFSLFPSNTKIKKGPNCK